MLNTPLIQDTDGRAPDKVVKLPISREEAGDSSPRARSAADQSDQGQDPHQPIGRILVLAKRLGANEVPRVLESAKRNRLRFGEAALKLGLIGAEDLRFALAQQFAFPYVGRDDASLSQDVLAAFVPNHPAIEQLRALRGQIVMRCAGGPRSRPVVAIVSPTRRDGRSFVAANLAVVFAQLGQRTLLIDASLRSPALHTFFKLDPYHGLSTALAGRSGLDCARAIGAMPGLQVMPAGPRPPNPLELIEQTRFSQLLDYAAAQFETVIIDTPANAEGPDAALLANRAGAAVLVVRADATRQPEARRFALALEQARTNVLGLVFNEKR
jgi:chain length determinant protein tyrosine kinase EpsG